MTDPTTYRLNHTMLRIKDPKESLDFYQNVLGMKLVHQMKNEQGKFTLYFLDYLEKGEEVPATDESRKSFVFSRRGVLELTHNWGTETDPDFKGYHNGNKDPQGFGHIAILVDDLEKACQRFEDLKVNFIKRIQDGRMHNIAFITDPDGYWIEVLARGFPSE
ncbi:MAG: lactoylglutathione lyase [Piptocephalis tieghemiana]|nr:MAG: lactoylglutathione lyase [Piptocephalis tieghemiana]